MKLGVDDRNKCRLVYVKFHFNRCRFAVAVAECLDRDCSLAADFRNIFNTESL